MFLYLLEEERDNMATPSWSYMRLEDCDMSQHLVGQIVNVRMRFFSDNFTWALGNINTRCSGIMHVHCLALM